VSLFVYFATEVELELACVGVVDIEVESEVAASTGEATHIKTVLRPATLWLQTSGECSTSSACLTAKASGSASRAMSLVCLNFWMSCFRTVGLVEDWLGMRWIVYLYLGSGLGLGLGLDAIS
jgi:hypothetical protein